MWWLRLWRSPSIIRKLFSQQQHPKRSSRVISYHWLRLSRESDHRHNSLYLPLGNINNLVGCCWFDMKHIQLEIDIDLLYFRLNCFLELEMFISLFLQYLFSRDYSPTKILKFTLTMREEAKVNTFPEIFTYKGLADFTGRDSL